MLENIGQDTWQLSDLRILCYTSIDLVKLLCPHIALNLNFHHIFVKLEPQVIVGIGGQAGVYILRYISTK